MEFLYTFLAATFVVFLVVIAPGPDTALVVRNSITKSRKDGFATTLGIVLGNTFFVTLGLIGFAAFIISSPGLFAFARYAGAAYLAFLGLQMILSKKKELVLVEGHGKTEFWKSFKEGLFTNLSNPKFLILLLSFFVQFIKPGMALYLQALIAYQFSILAFLWFSFLSYILTVRSIKNRISPFLHYVELVTGVMLIVFASSVFWGA